MNHHPFDAISFTFGVVFLLIAAVVGLGGGSDLSLRSWLLPASVLVLGTGLLVASLRGLTRRTDSGADDATS
ncbi:MAG: hypothetical protein KDB69_00430 [Acidimicrobiia bacterium]|nr:hypothetical protein [Acidimicrobiia bacterium]